MGLVFSFCFIGEWEGAIAFPLTIDKLLLIKPSDFELKNELTIERDGVSA